MLKFNEIPNQHLRLKIVGVGGAGNNVINNMLRNKFTGAELIALNTDLQVLEQSLADNTIQLGSHLVKGMGAGGNPEVGKLAAEESTDEIKEILTNTNVLFITAGMGGGTGTGAAPVIAKIARENNLLTIGIVTYPKACEGRVRCENADKGINELKNSVNSLIVIPNDRLSNQFADAELFQSYQQADQVVFNAARALADIINTSGYINVDLADVRTVMSELGYALIGVGEGEGENRVEKALKDALSNPLLGSIDLSKSKAILVNITAGYDMKTKEYDHIVDTIHDRANEHTNIIHGLVFNAEYKGRLNLAIIATGINEAQNYNDPIEHVIREKPRDTEKAEIQLVLERIQNAQKITPYD